MVGDSRPLVGYEACKFHVETTEAVEEWFCGGGRSLLRNILQ